MIEKVLVTYASEHGATAEIARAIAEILLQNGIATSLRPIRAVRGLGKYDAVIVGSAIYLGHWLKEAAEFLDNNLIELTTLPVWVFSSGPVGEGDVDELVNNALVPPDLMKIMKVIQPRDVVVFKGRLDYRRVSKAEKAILQAARVPSGDYRDWERIRSWAQFVSDDVKAINQQVAIH